MAVEIQILIFLFTFNSVNSINKRLLLNGPNQMEREIQELRMLVTTLKSQVAAIQQSKEKEINELKAQFSAVQQVKGGAQYTRWGKSVCPDNDTELVYDGFAAGGFFNAKGAGVNYLCLPRDPIWGSTYTGLSYATIYGAEYDRDASFFGTKNGDDLPCAVCRSRSGVTSMMLPGRNKCYQNWRMQYSGYLATGNNDHPSSKDYICIDGNPDALVAGGHNDDGADFYSVTAVCGALACPPYTNGRRLTCAVCTR